MSCSLLGILLLMFISENITIPISKISAVTQSGIDKDVRIVAEIESLRQSKDTLLLTAKDDTGHIIIVVFEPDNAQLKQGDLVEIQGKIAIYNNKLEIIAKTIKLV